MEDEQLDLFTPIAPYEPATPADRLLAARIALARLDGGLHEKLRLVSQINELEAQVDEDDRRRILWEVCRRFV